MKTGRFGVVGRLIADRPLTLVTAGAVGLVALAATSLRAPAGAAIDALPALIFGFLALPVAPLAFAGLAPTRDWRVAAAIIGAIGLLSLGLWFGAPFLNLDRALLDPRSLFGALLSFAAFIALRPTIGASMRFSFIGAASSVLAIAGASGTLLAFGASIADLAALGALTLALGAAVAIGVVSDFSSVFARGADVSSAAVAAGEQAITPAALAVALAFMAFSMHALFASPEAILAPPWMALLTTGLGVAIAAVAAAGALAVTDATESLAVSENARRQRLRRFWRPLRQALPPSAAYSVTVIAGILLVLAGFEMPERPSLAALMFAPAAAAVVGLFQMSMRAGAFVFILLAFSVGMTRWIASLIGAPALDALGGAVWLGMASTLFAMLALSWRNARSPRLNARETMEAALTDGLGRFAVALAAALGALGAAYFSNAWPEAALVALHVVIASACAGLIAPAVMTALSAMVGRER